MKAKDDAPRTEIYAQRLAKYADEHAEYTICNEIGSDRIKKRKNGESVRRGNNTYSSRQCSAHIRVIYPQTILQDNNETDFCCNCRLQSYKRNECKLCFVENNPKWQSTTLINLASSISGTVTEERLSADILYYLGTNYPNTYNQYSLLLVKRNGVVIKYYIKLIPYSSMDRTSTPSGYKYKDRITVSKSIKIQNNKYKDIILCIEDNVVHCVGFWNLLKDGGIRTYLQINKDNPIHVGFKCLIDRESTGIQSINVEFICNQHDKEKRKLLWHYDHYMSPQQTVLPPLPLPPLPPLPRLQNNNYYIPPPLSTPCNYMNNNVETEELNGYELSRAPTNGVMGYRMDPLSSVYGGYSSSVEQQLCLSPTPYMFNDTNSLYNMPI